jgi:hypothetical protein
MPFGGQTGQIINQITTTNKPPINLHPVFLKPQQAVPADDITNPLLDRLKPHSATLLALEVVDNSSQSLELASAAVVRAVV